MHRRRNLLGSARGAYASLFFGGVAVPGFGLAKQRIDEYDTIQEFNLD